MKGANEGRLDRATRGLGYRRVEVDSFLQKKKERKIKRKKVPTKKGRDWNRSEDQKGDGQEGTGTNYILQANREGRGSEGNETRELTKLLSKSS